MKRFTDAQEFRTNLDNIVRTHLNKTKQKKEGSGL
jgi:hypothetical protein